MDQFDSFFQELDSKQLIKEHGPSLVADAKETLRAQPLMRLAGTIFTPDSRDAPAFRSLLTKLTGQQVPEGIMMVGVCPRGAVEQMLTKAVGTECWLEEPWQEQRVLPIVASTRDGFRCAFIDLSANGPVA